MKKVVSAIMLLLTASVCALASQSNKTLEMQVAKAVVNATALATNAGAIDENITVEFGVKDFFGEAVSPSYGVGCKAYALDKNWLLIAGTCADPMDTYDELRGRMTPTSHEIYSYNKNVSLDYNHRVMLVWTDGAAPLKAPFIKVLATSTPKQLFTLNATHTVKINTSRWGTNAVRERNLKTGSITTKGDKQYFQLENKGMSGTATDPLFLIAPDSNEFLAGYNAGIVDYTSHPYGWHPWEGTRSDNWYTLTLEDLEFIKNTVQTNRPQDWNAIRTRLFYNNTDKPYFNK